MTTSTEVLFDPTDPELRRDPYPTYRRLREEAPAWRSPGGSPSCRSSSVDVPGA